MNLFSKCFLFIIGICLIWQKNYAQNNYHIQHFKVADGLPSNIIHSINFNPAHQLILGTQRGFTIYDGYTFQGIDSAHRIIESIINFDKYTIFHQNGGGIGIYNHDSKYFEQYIISPQYNDSDPNNDHFNQLYLDEDNYLWCSDYQFIKKINFKGQIIDSYQIHPHTHQLIPQFVVFKHHKQPVILTLDTVINAPISFKNDLPQHRTGIWKLSDEYLAWSTNKELIIYDYLNFKIVQKIPLSNKIKTIHKYNNDIWICTSNQLYKWTLNGEDLGEVYKNTDTRFNDFTLDTTTQIIWIASQHGLIQLTPNNTIFQHFPLPIIRGQKSPVIDIITLGSETYILQSHSIHIYNNLVYKSTINIPSKNVQHFIQHKSSLYLITSHDIYECTQQELKKIPISFEETLIKKALITSNDELWLMQESNILKRYNFNTYKALPPPQNDSFFLGIKTNGMT